VLGYGASPIPLPVLRASMEIFPDVLMQFYGTTETTGVISALGTAEHTDAATRSAWSGRDTTIRMRDRNPFPRVRRTRADW